MKNELEMLRKLNHDFFNILTEWSCMNIKNPDSVLYLNISQSSNWWLLNSLITWLCNHPCSAELKKNVLEKSLENLKDFISNENNRRSLKPCERFSYFAKKFDNLIAEILNFIKKFGIEKS